MRSTTGEPIRRPVHSLETVRLPERNRFSTLPAFSRFSLSQLIWRYAAPREHDNTNLSQPPRYKRRNVGEFATDEREREWERSDVRAMGEKATATVTIPSFVHTNVPASSSSTRFLGLLKQLDSEPIPSLELDESDVVWSSTFSSASSFPTDFSPASHSPPDRYLHRPPETRPFVPERSGLSAALADDSLPLVRQRRPAAAAARGGVPVPSGMAGAEEAGGRMRKVLHHSAPVNVPAWPSWRRVEVENWEEEREEEDEGEERLPPHVIVARTRGMTFSVFEGAGRTLKGRDLRQVRNSVLRKTGFL